MMVDTKSTRISSSQGNPKPRSFSLGSRSLNRALSCPSLLRARSSPRHPNRSRPKQLSPTATRSSNFDPSPSMTGYCPVVFSTAKVRVSPTADIDHGLDISMYNRLPNFHVIVQTFSAASGMLSPNCQPVPVVKSSILVSFRNALSTICRIWPSSCSARHVHISGIHSALWCTTSFGQLRSSATFRLGCRWRTAPIRAKTAC